MVSTTRLLVALAVIGAIFYLKPDIRASPISIIAVAAFSYLIVYVLISVYQRKVIAFDLHGVLFDPGWLKTDFVNPLREQPGMRQLIKNLKKENKVTALTNFPDELYRFYDGKFGLSRLFDDAVWSGKVGVAKPEPGIYRAALKKFKTKPENMVFVDDVEKNVEAAKKFGIRAIHFKSQGQLVEDLKKVGVAVPA